MAPHAGEHGGDRSPGRPVIEEVSRRVAAPVRPVRAVAARAWAWLGRQRPPSLAGAGLGGGVLCGSLTPSPPPRAWLIQGLVGGVSAPTGDAIRAPGGWGGRRVLRWGPRARGGR